LTPILYASLELAIAGRRKLTEQPNIILKIQKILTKKKDELRHVPCTNDPKKTIIDQDRYSWNSIINNNAKGNWR